MPATKPTHDPARRPLCLAAAALQWESDARCARGRGMRAETDWPRGGRAFWVAAAVATVLTLACALNSLRWLNRPFPGFFVWDNLFVPAVGDTDWTGYEAAIPYHGRLLA